MLRLDKNLRRARRTAFSLAELVISVGILILMMALAGQVFSITIKSTGQATALTEVTQQLRVFEETLREDLRNVQPGQSVMLIQGNPVNAYWTQLGKDADDDQKIPADGYGHIRDLERERLDANGIPVVDGSGNPQMVEPRADILMFFTARKATSFVNPSVSSRVQQVVYGHAELREYDPADLDAPITSPSFPTLPAPFAIPAQRWHLARRSVLILPKFNSNPKPPEILQENGILLGETDSTEDLDYTKDVLRPQLDNSGSPVGFPWYLPAAFGESTPPFVPARSQLDPTPPMMMANRMGAYFLPNCASFKVEWALDPRSTFVAGRLVRTSEVFWFDPGDNGATMGDKDNPLRPLEARIKQLDANGACNNESNPQYGLCQDLRSLLCDQTRHADGRTYSLSDRFLGKTCQGSQYASDEEWEQLAPDGQKPNLIAFTAGHPTGKCSQSSQLCLVDTDCAAGQCIPAAAVDDIWPGALRITVDLYDREFRLERPIRHVMVIPIGE